MLDFFYNVYKEKIIQFILYRFQRSIGITNSFENLKLLGHSKNLDKIYLLRWHC